MTKEKYYVVYDCDHSKLVPQDGSQRIFGGEVDTKKFFDGIITLYPVVHFELMTVECIRKSWEVH